MSNAVSIIVPVYNAEKFLHDCIESVIKQSFSNWELILVDNGSTDGSVDIIEKYIQQDPRIQTIKENKRGPAAARNAGVAAATGSTVFFLDADDFITSNALEVLTDALDQTGAEMAMGNFSKLNPDGKMVDQPVTFDIHEKPFTGNKRELSRLETTNYVHHFLHHPSNHLISYCWARLFRLETIRKYKITANEDMQLFEDLIFNLEYLKHSDKIVFVNAPIYIYRMHESHMSASMGILNSSSLIHDMNIFKEKIITFFDISAQKDEMDIVRSRIGHALIHYVIIFLVRTCRWLCPENRGRIQKEISPLISSPILRDSLPYYHPRPGTSRWLPRLMRWKLTGIIMLVCKNKAYKRYGKLKGNAR
jgi:glycosyltransferase involved in cell wall biosynthesis